MAIVYSRWGQRSGAHLNPAVTLTFWRLGKVRAWDALLYVTAQFVGAIVGVGLAAALLGPRLADPAMSYAATVPGTGGAVAAFGAELLMTFLLMTVILIVTNRPGLNRFTGLFAGMLVPSYIVFEAPVSGMSLNPARTLGSAVHARPLGARAISTRIAHEGRQVAYGFEHLNPTRPSPLILRYTSLSLSLRGLRLGGPNSHVAYPFQPSYTPRDADSGGCHLRRDVGADCDDVVPRMAPGAASAAGRHGLAPDRDCRGEGATGPLHEAGPPGHEGVARGAYREFEERVGQVETPRGAKTALVEAAIQAFPSQFTLGDLE
jgi:hypothetical protein